SSASEMAAKGGVGIEIETEKVPLRESGMEPYEVVISESQERMLAVVEPDKADRVLGLAEHYGLVGAVVGHVAGHGDLRVKSGGESVGSVPAEHLADAPIYEREVVRPSYLDEVQELDLGSLSQPEDYNEVLLRMLAHPNLCSRRSIFEQYDHEVGADTVVAPGADAAVMRIKGTKLGYALTTDGRGRHCYLDPRGGGAATVAEAYRNISCVGAEPVAITNCLNFGSPEKPEGYYQLAECIEGMAEACEALGTPVVSGNVSLYNETEAGAVYPTPVVGMVGVFEDVCQHATPSFKRGGDEVVSLGSGLWSPSLAGSEYLEIIHDKVSGAPPRPDLAGDKFYSDLVRRLVAEGIVDTAHDVSGGGWLVALAEMALAGGIGIEINEFLVEIISERRADVELFGELSGHFLIVAAPGRWDDLQNALGEAQVPYDQVGTTGGDSFKVPGFVDLSLDELRGAYERDLFGAPGGAEVAH
ncbi:MAG TPA: AIR synthase-related protein, partial [Rubrobacteraceae bacterium]|nr:AIR synthase-related protein [Rubrobacteraceae bacterium]